MKILILTKRQYAQKDIIDDRYGRFREFPRELARLGHKVKGLCLSYQTKKEGVFVDEDVQWYSLNLGKGQGRGFLRYAREAYKQIKAFEPDIIYTFSDSLYAILGYWLSAITKKPYVVDLYDNFETYQSARIPFVPVLYSRALKNARGITSFSALLNNYLKEKHSLNVPIMLLESSINPEVFYPQDQMHCRKQLGLPENAQIISYAGAIFKNRGVDTLFKAFDRLVQKDENVYLVLAGQPDEETKIPESERIIYLGNLDWSQVPMLYCASNISVVCYKNNLFARHSYPFKGKEIIACRTPIVAADIGCMHTLLENYPQCLYEPENVESLLDALQGQLASPFVIDLEIKSWKQLTKEMEFFFQGILPSTEEKKSGT